MSVATGVKDVQTEDEVQHGEPIAKEKIGFEQSAGVCGTD
jgi:hypothetical protein